MRTFVALLIGVLIGLGAYWFYTSQSGKSTLQTTGQQIENATKSARDAIVVNLRTNEIKEELAKTGQVIRRKARQAGQAIADATADARTTAAIKAKLVAHPDLSALTISVNTTAGAVTLSGTVPSLEDISKAMTLALETDGVQEVISTLQVKPKG